MRVIHTADWHLGKSLEGHSRLEEQEAFLNDFIEIVENNNIDLVIIAGDVYDSSNPKAKAENLFYDTLKRLSKNGERIILVIAGNHDNPERLVAAGPLARQHGIIMIGTPKSVIEKGNYGNHKVLDSGEGFIEIEINNEKAVILTVPYPSEKRLDEILYDEMDGDEENIKAYGDRIKTLFENLEKNFREDTINLAVTHLFAMGSEEGGSERSIQLGGSYIVDGSYLPKKAQYIALGHVHKPQIVPNTERRARYSGSPLQYNKREINFQKKCLIIEVHPKEECTVEEINLKIYKKIDIYKCNGIEEAIEMCKEKKDEESYVYIEINTDRFIREDEIKEMKSYKKDILEIVPKIKDIDEEDEGANIEKEKSFEEIFKDFYKKERGMDADEEILNLILSIVDEEE